MNAASLVSCVASYGNLSVATQPTCRTEYHDALSFNISLPSPPIIIILPLLIAQVIKSLWKNKTAQPESLQIVVRDSVS